MIRRFTALNNDSYPEMIEIKEIKKMSTTAIYQSTEFNISAEVVVHRGALGDNIGTALSVQNIDHISPTCEKFINLAFATNGVIVFHEKISNRSILDYKDKYKVFVVEKMDDCKLLTKKYYDELNAQHLSID